MKIMTTFKPNQIKRIPYQGSKYRLAGGIIDTMLTRLDPSHPRYFVDMFGGGGAISSAVAEFYPQEFTGVHYNELNTGVFKLYHFLTTASQNDVESFLDARRAEWITREEFNALKGEPTVLGGYYACIWSFGNNQHGYIYGDKVYQRKKDFHSFLLGYTSAPFEKYGIEIELPDRFELLPLDERRLTAQRQIIKISKPLFTIFEQYVLERINQLQAFTNFHPTLSYSNASYSSVELPVDAVVYADPPYEGTAGYGKQSFPHEPFNAWLEELTERGVPTFVSEYNLQVEGYHSISEQDVHVNLARDNQKKATEKLFWNGVK